MATTANWGRAMMNRSNVSEKFRTQLFQYAVITATNLDMLLVFEVEDSRAMTCVHWTGSVTRFEEHLRTLGEVGTVTTKTGSTHKPRDRGVHCMFVGYTEGHTGDFYQMWNPYTNKVYESKDAIFLNRIFYETQDDLFSSIMKSVPEVEGMGETDTNEDDMEEEEIIIGEKIMKIRWKNDFRWKKEIGRRG